MSDEQGPDTADLDRILATFALYGGKEPPRESEGWYLRWALGEVRSLRGEITAARSERATAITEYKALHKRSTFHELTQRAERAEAELAAVTAERDRWEKAALDWSEEGVRHRGEIRRLGETLAVERKQAAQQALTAVMAVPYCRDVGHTEAIHSAAGCCDPYETPCAAMTAAIEDARAAVEET